MAILSPCNAISKFRKSNKSSVHKKSKREVSVPFPLLHLQQRPQQPAIPINIELDHPKIPHKKKGSTTTDILRLMDCLSFPIPQDMYSSLLKDCTHSKDMLGGWEVHQHMLNRMRGGFSLGLHLANRLLLLYVSCGRMDVASHLFDNMPLRDSISWATLIIAHTHNYHHCEAMRLFVDMQESSAEDPPTSSILNALLKACIQEKDFEFGEQLHGWLLKTGRSKDLFLTTSLINFYGKFGCLDIAQAVFDRMSFHNTVHWTAMIVAYCGEHQFDLALEAFNEMGRAGLRKNKFTFSSILRACAGIARGERQGRQVHAQTIKIGVETDAFVQSSLVNMYGKSGLLGDARRAFEIVPTRNMVCWTAMLGGYMQHGHYKETIKFLYQMKAAGIEPQQTILDEIKTACGN